MAGRKPNPRKLSVLHGAGPASTTTDTPVPSEREPKPPAWFTTDQRAIWNEITEELREMHALHRADLHELINLVMMVANVQRMGRQIFKDGVLVTSTTGATRTHPLLSGYERGMRIAHTMAGAFGLHPAGRASLHLGKLSSPTEDGNESFERHFTAL